MRRRVSFDCDSDGSTSCGGCHDERGEEQERRENGAEFAEECRYDQNFMVILPSTSARSEPLCEMSDEWTRITSHQ